MMQSTFAIIKPDAVASQFTGEILAAMEASGLRIVALKRLHLSKTQAAGFYAVHRERPFFDSLTNYMSSGPLVCVVLRGEDAVPRWRALMGATNPAQAESGTIRAKYGQSIEANAVHGSDAQETAAFEIGYFFSGLEISE